jgi:hypothetical protein
MAQVCGIHRGPRVAEGRLCGRHVLRALALCVAVAALGWTAGAARADSSPPRPSPQPQNLWHAYPLDAGSSSAGPSHASRVAAQSPAGGSGRPAVLLWVAIAAFGAAAATFVVSRRRTGQRWRLVDRFAEQRLALAADGASSVEVEPVAAPKQSAAPKEPTLKWKQTGETRSEARTLKEKERQAPPDRSTDDVSILRAKLAKAAPKRAAAAAPARLRPVPATLCQIGWWRGYVKSEFQAYSASADRQRAVVATSPAFRWSKPEPPPADLPEAVSAHAVLREELEAAGWVAAGKGEHWYAIEFERRPSVAGRGKGDHEQ